MESPKDLRDCESTYYAHTEGAHGSWEPLREHLAEVATKAAQFALPFGSSDEAYNAGLLHDLGKYGDRFQQRLRGEAKGVDHWFAGAWKALHMRHGATVALAVQGHHIGLQRGDKDALRRLGSKPPKPSPSHLQLSHLAGSAIEAILSRFAQDELTLREPASPVMDDYAHAAAAMLDVRMLFSALVDADFLATERHFDGKERPTAPVLDCDAMLASLKQYVELKAEQSRASLELNRLRGDLRHCCRTAAERSPGIFTLTAPTGSGKTLAMLEFALRHAKANGLRRVVSVAPYLSIIDQTTDVYRSAMGIGSGEHEILLEHHSLVVDERNGGDDERRERERLAENWDASIVLTTSVQILESLFSNRPGACRKLHRLAGAVILFDEIQTLPLPLVAATLATLSRLVKHYNATVVFATATQPAFGKLSPILSRYAEGGWMADEINLGARSMFQAARRVDYRWSPPEEQCTWAEVADRMCNGEAQALCIVNTKKQASALYEQVRQRVKDCLHLSTAMCPAHRRAVLDNCTSRLDAGKACIMVATQCVEAGVDLDFLRVFRAVGPLDSIAQAAGRCNRNQRRARGVVEIFRPVDEQWPRDEAYQAAAELAWTMRERDLHDPQVFSDYFADLYSIQSLDQLEHSALYEAILAYDFVAVAKEYRLIKDNSVNVITPYGEGSALAQAVRNDRLTAEWVRKARSFSINVPRYQIEKAPELFEPVPLANRRNAEGWYILQPEAYSQERGFEFPGERANYLCV
jgi:CRISPR-associated endonuclease/helicase Cas3